MGKDMKSFEYWFDFGSPAAYLAFTQLQKLEGDTNSKALYRPMLLGGVFQATGNQSPASVPAKGAYTFKDFDRFAKRYGVPFNSNPYFPINTLLLMRGAIGMQQKEPERFLAYCKAVFQAIWVEALNMNDPAIVGAVLHNAGFDPQSLMTLANETPIKEALKAATTEAVARGVFGAPTFFVGSQMFWGQDRLDFVKEALQ
jgi:2-hydroxychromene-2-carboxylate isomerase